MKTLLVLFLFLLSLLSCQDTNCSGKDVSEDMEEPVDTTPKATAIFWVDKDKDYQAKKKDGPLSLRTVKASMGHRTKRFFQWSGKMGERF